MSAGSFSPDSVPSRDESEARASQSEWQRMENRRQWRLVLACAVAAALVVVGVLLWLNGGEPS